MPNKHYSIAIAFLTVCTVFIIGCKKADKSAELTILSYNVAGLPAGISSSKPDRNTSFIAQLINGYDVVHVQEDFNYHDTLLTYSTYPYVTPTMGQVIEGDGLNVFSKFPIQNLVRVKWDTCADFDCYTPKGFSHHQIELDGVLVDMYNVHTNAQSYEEALFARRENCMQLYNYIETHSVGRPVLIFGDMNSRYSRLGDTIRVFENLGFKDAWVEAVRGGVYPEKNGESLADCEPDRSGANCEKVDKVLYRGNGQIRFSVKKYQLDDSRFYYNNDPNEPLSDHWPLFVTFTYSVK